MWIPSNDYILKHLTPNKEISVDYVDDSKPK